MILYVENPNDATRKLLQLMQDTKLKNTKSVAFIYTNNKLSEREIKETIPFTIPSKRIKYLGINLPKEPRDLYSKNNRTL